MDGKLQAIVSFQLSEHYYHYTKNNRNTMSIEITAIGHLQIQSHNNISFIPQQSNPVQKWLSANKILIKFYKNVN